jgi:hypothetical protein
MSAPTLIGVTICNLLGDITLFRAGDQLSTQGPSLLSPHLHAPWQWWQV